MRLLVLFFVKSSENVYYYLYFHEGIKYVMFDEDVGISVHLLNILLLMFSQYATKYFYIALWYK